MNNVKTKFQLMALLNFPYFWCIRVSPVQRFRYN